MSEMRRCPACDATVSRSVGIKNDRMVNACNGCGTWFADCEQSAPAGHYDDYYSDDANRATPSFVQKRLDEIVSAFAAHRSNNRLLDVGFGSGALLDAAARAGWEVHGVEVSAAAVQHVRGQHPNVREGLLEDVHYPDQWFDVVIASEILEHLSDPTKFLTEIRRILRPGGLLWATTPHGRGISARLLGTEWSVVYPPDHMQLFSVAGMRRLMRRVGFRRMRIATHGADPVEIANAIRKRLRPKPVEVPIHRLNSLQPLNRVFVETRSGRVTKTVINGVLNAARLGDSLKIFAEA